MKACGPGRLRVELGVQYRLERAVRILDSGHAQISARAKSKENHDATSTGGFLQAQISSGWGELRMLKTLAFSKHFDVFFSLMRGIMVTNRLRLQRSSISQAAEWETMEDRYAAQCPRWGGLMQCSATVSKRINSSSKEALPKITGKNRKTMCNCWKD